MKVVVLDYSGHLPQADLSKKLAESGLDVLHLYCTDHRSGTADFKSKSSRITKLEFKGVSAGYRLDRYNVRQRLLHEIRIARRVFSEIIQFSPRVVIVSNMPLVASYILTSSLRFKKLPYIYWWQDVYSEAISNELNLRFSFKGIKAISSLATYMEKSCLKSSKAVVAISDKFEQKYTQWNLQPSKFNVYPNWSAPEDFALISAEESLVEGSYILYAGTLGLKHNPKILLELADLMMNDFPELFLVIVSEGLGREFLSLPENIRANIILKDFMPFKDLQNILFHAKAVIAILEPHASEYSVPSKVMTYFCSGKPIIAALDSENQVAHYIRDSNSGFVVDTENAASMYESLKIILKDENLRSEMQKNARLFAEQNFSGVRASQFFVSLMY